MQLICLERRPSPGMKRGVGDKHSGGAAQQRVEGNKKWDKSK
jgi:hypothetical protein